MAEELNVGEANTIYVRGEGGIIWEMDLPLRADHAKRLADGRLRRWAGPDEGDGPFLDTPPEQTDADSDPDGDEDLDDEGEDDDTPPELKAFLDTPPEPVKATPAKKTAAKKAAPAKGD